MVQEENETGKDVSTDISTELSKSGEAKSSEAKTGDVKELITAIAKTLVDKPDEVVVDAITQGESTILRLRVAASDIGKVIGKQGRTARSLRTIISAASMKLQHRFSLDIIEDKDAIPSASTED
jgi:predicted RNA-binding protein YlqC (UPF0109 family)